MIRVAVDPDDNRGFIYTCLDCAYKEQDKAKIEFANAITDPNYDFSLYHTKNVGLKSLKHQAKSLDYHLTEAMLVPVCDDGDNLIYLKCPKCKRIWDVTPE